MSGTAEIRVAGKTYNTSAAEICGRTVVVTGRWLRVATIKDEELVEGSDVAAAPRFIEQVRQSKLGADILSFAQKLPETTPRYGYLFEWDSWAAIPITSFQAWWDKLPQESRKNVRRAAKRGVTVRIVEFNDDLVRGIHAIYNETPLRQGRRFWHYGKDFETVKREAGTYTDRSDFVGAYRGDELVGFIKIVYVDRVATLIHIISKTEHHDSRPTNALLARAVELSAAKNMSFLVYGKYVYGRHTNSLLTEFKRRNGFEEIRVPRYLLALNRKGAFAIRFGLHAALRERMPAPVVRFLLTLRGRLYNLSTLFGCKRSHGVGPV